MDVCILGGMNGILLSDGVSTYVYDAANRLTSVDGPSTGSGQATYTWDANGNTSTSSVHCLLNDGVSTYAYDSANRLISVTGPLPFWMGSLSLWDQSKRNPKRLDSRR